MFRSLYEHVHGEAKAAGDVVGLRLYVERENGAAQETYRRLGMVKTSYELLEKSPL